MVPMGNVLTTPKLVCLPMGPKKLLRNSLRCQEGSRTDLAPCHASPGKAGVHLERRPGAGVRGRPRHALDVPQGPQPRQREVRGFFGTLKSDFFGGRDWAGVTFEEFSRRLDAYIEWYRSEKVKKALGLEDDQAAQGGAWLYCVA